METVKDLKEALRTLQKEIAEKLNDFEEEYDFRTAGINEERDPETREIVAVVIPIFDEEIYG
jgi:hypothetical protein